MRQQPSRQLPHNLRCPRGLLEPDAWKAGTSGSEGALAQQCAGATRRWHIQRRRKRGYDGKKAVYTYPSKKSLASVTYKVRSLTRRHKHRTLADLLHAVNRVLRGWCNYFRHGVCKRTFNYLDHFAWWRIVGWLRKRHAGLNWGTLHRRHLPNWEISDGAVQMLRPQAIAIERYRYRGTRIPTPWTSTQSGSPAPTA